MKNSQLRLEGWPEHKALTHETVAGQMFQARNPTTSFLTAATLIYAIGAGITAAAGTRLALQLLLVKCFKLYPLQSRNGLRRPSCYFLSLPPRIGIG